MPVATLPHLQVQLSTGLGSGFFEPHSGQNLPVAVAPQEHFQPLTAGAGAAATGAAAACCCYCCMAMENRFWAFMPPAC